MRPRPPQQTTEVVNRALRGFTLIDLLVIVAILSMLGAIALGASSANRRKSQSTRCAANLQKLNTAVLSFANDHGQTLPTVVTGDTRPLWWWYKEQVKRYVGLTGESSKNDIAFACPNDRGYSEPAPFHDTPRFDFSSYVYNGVTMPGVPSVAGLQLSSIQHPTKTLLLMEWTAHAPLSWHRSRTGRSNSPFYCDAQSLVGFVDGHVSLTRIYYDGYNAAYTRDPIEGYDYQYSEN
jgi:type II secretory pathway pseudopilin PulG